MEMSQLTIVDLCNIFLFAIIVECRYGTECVSRGDMRKHNCIDYECTVLTQNNQQYAQMKPLYYGNLKFVDICRLKATTDCYLTFYLQNITFFQRNSNMFL